MIKYAIALAVLLVIAAFMSWAFLPTRYLPSNRARYLRLRLHLRLHPGKGFATVLSLWLHWGRLAALRRSRRIRRSLPLWLRLLDTHAHSVFLGRAHYRHGLRVPLEEHLLLMAPPRTFKTAFLADVILRYPGPVIATTTKADVFALTAAARAHHGPVHIFNPQGIGGAPSTFRWSPVAGCEDPATAIRRADAFAFAVSHKGVEDGTFWSAKASDYLRGYFHAAALMGADLRTVATWVSGADPHVPEQVLTAAGAHQWAVTLAELRGEAHKTVATVRMVMTRALSFMADPALATSVLPGPGEGFDIAAFLRDTGTLYLIAEAVSTEAPVAPLFAAMASEIHYAAAQIGQASPSGRLDPPLLMGLDEVTQICPVPLPFWLADSGGKGIQVIAVAHGEAQLVERWGEHGRQVILDRFSLLPPWNLAIATGAPGPDVLDVDQHGPAGNGFAALERLRRAGLLDGASACVRTPRGGLHIYFGGSSQHNGHLARQHVDFGSAGGYILAPPSQVDGRPYRLLKTLEGQGGLDWSAVTGLLQPRRQPDRPESPRGMDSDVGRLARWVARQAEGNRNAGLFWAASRALEADRAANLGPLADAARQAGLTEREITRTLDSARKTREARPVQPDREAEALR